jgi:methyltransferase (TIGR00027 family)
VFVRQGTPSRTAQGVARRRATHQLLDHPRVFDDPLALRILGEDDARALATDRARFDTAPRLRAFVAARSRYSDDELAMAFARGVRQCVVLGAGLDTFAYRNPYAASGLRVFEVDHPDTQAWKRECLEAAGIAIPASVAFVPVDFENASLAECLKASGFDAGQPAFFSWLGVIPYLSLEAARATLAWIASLPRETAVVFDYGVDPALLSPALRAAFEILAERVRRAGEPFRLFFNPADLAAMLRELGFHDIEDLHGAEIDRRYFHGRTDDLRAAGAAHLIRARV